MVCEYNGSVNQVVNASFKPTIQLGWKDNKNIFNSFDSSQTQVTCQSPCQSSCRAHEQIIIKLIKIYHWYRPQNETVDREEGQKQHHYPTIETTVKYVTDSVRASHRTPYVSTRINNMWLSYIEMACYLLLELHNIHKYSVYRKCRVFSVKHGGTCRCH